MTFETTAHFDRAFRKLPPAVKAAFEKQAATLLKDLRHPSLRAKKYDESYGIWQARVNDNVRFYFTVTDSCYTLLDIRKHAD